METLIYTHIFLTLFKNYEEKHEPAQLYADLHVSKIANTFPKPLVCVEKYVTRNTASARNTSPIGIRLKSLALLKRKTY